jgi:hypothetical protein
MKSRLLEQRPPFAGAPGVRRRDHQPQPASAQAPRLTKARLAGSGVPCVCGWVARYVGTFNPETKTLTTPAGVTMLTVLAPSLAT